MKHTDRDERSTDHHSRETIFRIGVSALGLCAGQIVLLKPWSHKEGETQADPNGNERKTSMTSIPTVILCEDNREAKEEGVLWKAKSVPLTLVTFEETLPRDRK